MKILKIFFAALIILALFSKLAWHFKPEWFLKDGIRKEDVSADSSFDKAENTVTSLQAAKTAFNLAKNYINNEKEYKDTGTLSFDFPLLREQDDYLALIGKIDFLADKERFFRRSTKIDGLKVETDYILHHERVLQIQTVRALDAAGNRLLNTTYRYADGKPVDAFVVLNELETAEPQRGVNTYRLLGSQLFIWQADGTLWKKGKASAVLLKYTENHCAACYREALELGRRAVEERQQQQNVREAQQQSNAIATNKNAYIQLNDVATIMPQGMKHNSLVVGYDHSGVPEKIYYSYDNGRKRQSFEYYLKQGTVFKARSSTVALAADGITADTETDHREQHWVLQDGKVIEEKRGLNDKLPDYPLSQKMIDNEPSRLAEAAKR